MPLSAHRPQPKIGRVFLVHIVTTNPLLSPYMNKVVKMWRKLGAWLWLATQNLADCPLTAEKTLNMAEWWLCLTMPPLAASGYFSFPTASGRHAQLPVDPSQ